MELTLLSCGRVKQAKAACARIPSPSPSLPSSSPSFPLPRRLHCSNPLLFVFSVLPPSTFLLLFGSRARLSPQATEPCATPSASHCPSHPSPSSIECLHQPPSLSLSSFSCSCCAVAPRRSAPSSSIALGCACSSLLLCSRRPTHPLLSLVLSFLPPCILHCAGLIPAGLLYSIMFQKSENTRLNSFNDLELPL